MQHGLFRLPRRLPSLAHARLGRPAGTAPAADIYGPSESLIGRYLKDHPAEKPHVQVRGRTGGGAAAAAAAGRDALPGRPLHSALTALRLLPPPRPTKTPHLHTRTIKQVLTKFCCFGDAMRQAQEARFVEQARAVGAQGCQGCLPPLAAAAVRSTATAAVRRAAAAWRRPLAAAHLAAPALSPAPPQSIDASRQRLQLESLDLVQFYWHDYGTKGYVQAAQHLAALQARCRGGARGAARCGRCSGLPLPPCLAPLTARCAVPLICPHAPAGQGQGAPRGRHQLRCAPPAGDGRRWGHAGEQPGTQPASQPVCACVCLCACVCPGRWHGCRGAPPVPRPPPHPHRPARPPRTPPRPAPQVQYSLLDRRPENGMAAFCGAHGILLLPYGVVAGGLLTDKYLGKTPQE